MLIDRRPASGRAAWGARRHEQGCMEVATSSVYRPPCRRQGPPGELGAAAPAVEELDLSGCLLPSWAAAARLAAELPRLQTLDLSGARLAFPEGGRPERRAAGGPGRAEEPGAEPVRDGAAAGTGHTVAGGQLAHVGEPGLRPSAEGAAVDAGSEAALAVDAAGRPGAAAHLSATSCGAGGRAADAMRVPVAFGVLRLLVLSRTGARWDQVRMLAAGLPSLGLAGPRNCLACPPFLACAKAAKLHAEVTMEGFLFGGQVLRLGAWLPALQELHLCANGICSLAAPDFGCDAAGGSAMLARLQARPGPACKQSTPNQATYG